MASLREIQMCQLGILKDVADFCDKYNIKYYLAAGSLLGAVRHKGFIPWDDDIDIMMEYSELNRFKKLFIREMSEQYFYQDYKTDPGYIMLFPKIRKNNTYMPEDVNARINQGVWIDIFPLISFGENYNKNKKIIKKIFLYQYLLAEYGSAFIEGTKKRRIDEVFIYLKSLRIKKYYYVLGSQKKSNKHYIALGNRFWGECTPKKINIVLDHVFDQKWFLKRKLYSFEQYSFWSITNYDEYLCKEYGENYMIPIKVSHLSDYSDVKL